MKDATATLQGGLKASEREGIPISAKFEIEDGKLQLSVYIMNDNDFTEVVADPNTGAIGDRSKSCDGKGEGALAHRHGDRGQGKSRVPGGQHLSTTAERPGCR